ncbi:long tail fiber, proximal subunit [Serratia phage PS2]|uniref:Long tail fiber, proximal subunit n=1 Tax=Serratia phage PS2 TaxID=1481112 RepID=A0A023W601_9CAUD|nr:tail fiber protein proximal subunit [Serratia phage PS2]AHY25488.1 long tail fiber, proximal subunit [Serratia phage PS2]
MADKLKPAFRVAYGLDAATEKVINVGMADKNVGSDGVNVDFFNEYNTLPHYKENRGYDVQHAVIFNNRAWYALENIPKPAGPFNPAKWQSLRVDPTWENTGNVNPVRLRSGQYLEIFTGGGAVTYTLPEKPTKGDTITIKNSGARAGHGEPHVISTEAQPLYNINVYDQLKNNSALTRFIITKNRTTITMVFDGSAWNLQEDQSEHNIVRMTQGTESEVNVGDVLMAMTSKGTMSVKLPKNVMDGESIQMYDAEGYMAKYHVTVKPNTGQKIDMSTSNLVCRKTGVWTFTWNQASSSWTTYNTDKRMRVRQIQSSTTAESFDYIMYQNMAGTTLAEVVLPDGVENGDMIIVDCKMMRRGQKLTVKVQDGTPLEICTTRNEQIPRYSEYGVAAGGALPRVKSIDVVAGIDQNYPAVMTFSYMESADGSTRLWYLIDSAPQIERVDAKNRSRVGVAPLATQDEVNKNHEQNPDDESIVTPKTLANMTATVDRRGIAMTVGPSEILETDEGKLNADKMVTVYRLNQRTALENRKGVAAIATQSEAHGSTDDAKIITAKKLNNRKASPTQTGIAATVTPGGQPGSNRTAAGTGVYNHADEINIVTPKVLREYKATETASGAVWLATDDEVRNGTQHAANIPTVVTPVSLGRRIAQESNHGLIAIASQSETNTGTNDTKAITPKKLNERLASDTMSGISRFASDAEFAAGTKDSNAVATVNAKGQLSVDPSRIKAYFSANARWSQDTESGTDISGNYWDGMSYKILKATVSQRGTLRIATDAEVKNGSINDVIVTPLTLQNKKASTVAWGITRYGTDAEMYGANDATAGSITTNLLGLKRAFKNGINDATYNGFAARMGGDVTGIAGVVQLANEDYSTGVVDKVNGTTKYDLSKSKGDGWAITPRGLHLALQNYVPVQGVAYDSARLGGVVASDWVRRTVAQTITAVHTFSEIPVFSKGATASAGEISAPRIVSRDNHSQSLVIGTTGQDGASGLQIRSKRTGVAGQNDWTIWSQGGQSADLGVGQFGIGPGDGKSPVLILDSNGSSSVKADFGIGGKLTVSGADISLQGRQVVTKIANQNTLEFGRNNAVRIGSTDANSTVIINTAGAEIGKVLHTGNVQSHLDPVYLRQDGGTVSTSFVVKNTGVRSDVATFNKVVSNSPVSSYPNGYFCVEIVDTATANTYPRFAPYPGQDPNQYPADTANTGTLTQVGQDTGRIQYWSRKGSRAVYVRTVAANGTSWNAWGRMYTSDMPPAPDEIGAWKPGEVTDSITVTDYVKIKNLIIRPNPVTKTVDFEWTDN